MTERQLNNRKILDILRREYPEFADTYDFMKKAIETFDRQRFGQIWCNYICPDYRSLEPSENTIKMMDALFTDNRDPFFEESSVTLERLSKV